MANDDDIKSSIVHGQPPNRGWFPKGKSGNPRGRPKKQKSVSAGDSSVRDAFLEAAGSLMKLTENRKAVTLTQRESVERSQNVAARMRNATVQAAASTWRRTKWSATACPCRIQHVCTAMRCGTQFQHRRNRDRQKRGASSRWLSASALPFGSDLEGESEIIGRINRVSEDRNHLEIETFHVERNVPAAVTIRLNEPLLLSFCITPSCRHHSFGSLGGRKRGQYLGEALA